MKLSPHEIADFAIKAGFSKTTIVPGTTDSEAVVAVAVALAESGGDTEIISRTTAPVTSDPGSVGQRDHGLFQLSGRWQYPKIQAANGRWRDPLVNTQIAYEIFKGANRTFSPWSVTVKNSSGVAPYEQYLPDARMAVSQPWIYADDTMTKLTSLQTSVNKFQTALDSITSNMVKLTTAVNDLVTKVTAQDTKITDLQTKNTEIRNHFK